MPLFFPRYHLNEVDPLVVKGVLCRCFSQWGLPQAIKVDNGKPFGDPQRTSVPVLALWLLGLGVTVVWNRPRCPRDNAKVERMQATTARWSDLHQCVDEQDLQARLNEAACLQREHYPVRSLRNKSRTQCYPELWQNQRTYPAQGFQLQRVYQYLSQVVFARKVNASGVLTFYAQAVYTGTAYHHQTLSIQFDARQTHWLLTNGANQVVACFAADNFSAEAICNLNVCRNRSVKCSNLVA
jgi:hypothetical protein